MHAIALGALLASVASAALAGAAACGSTSDPVRAGNAGDTRGGDSDADVVVDAGAGGKGSGGTTGTTGTTGGAPGCAAGQPFDPAALEASVVFLASDDLAGRAPGTPGDEAARAYIADRFACLGLIAAGEGGSYQQPFVTTDDKSTTNVVGWLEGSDPVLAAELIVVGAHHDHLGTKGGQIYNGANDNASGVAAMLAIAHAVKQRAIAPKRSIAFVAFGYEEHDGLCEGSELFVQSPPGGLQIQDVVYMVNTDMVGVYPLEQSLTAYGSFGGTPGRAVLAELLELHPGLNVELDVAADQDASDFQAFCDAGIPYLYFETWDEPCWHEPCDDADRIDYASMSEIATLAFEVVMGLADGKADLAAAVHRGSCMSAAATSRPGRRHDHHRHQH